MNNILLILIVFEILFIAGLIFTIDDFMKKHKKTDGGMEQYKYIILIAIWAIIFALQILYILPKFI